MTLSPNMREESSGSAGLMSNSGSSHTEVGSSDESHQLSLEQQEHDDDPLAVKQLSLNFEYLMYKINDRVKTLSEQTEELIVLQNLQYVSDVERVDRDLEKVDKLMKNYKEIMNEFVKLEQLDYIVKDFNTRLTDIERKMKNL